jgi:hypothetical protein
MLQALIIGYNCSILIRQFYIKDPKKLKSNQEILHQRQKKRLKNAPM